MSAGTLDLTSDLKLDAIANAVASLDPADLWRPEKLAAVYGLSQHRWEVNSALDRRRRTVLHKEALQCLDREPALKALVWDDEELMYPSVSLPELLNEYDELTSFPSSTLYYIQYKEELTKSDLAALHRAAELREVFTKHDINWALREKVATAITEFRMALSANAMNNTLLNSTDCELLEPVAAYLANPDIQNGYLTKYFILCFLGRLRHDVSSRVRTWKRYKWATLLAIACIPVLTYAGLDSLLSHRSLETLVCVCLFSVAGRVRSAYSGTQADALLSDLEARFGYLNAPLTEDGRELICTLRKVQSLQVGVPSLLSSLFRIALPGR